MRQENRTYNVLMVDDERLVCSMATAFLRHTEFRLVTTNTVSEALYELRHSTFDIIISDVVMEPLDGFAFREEVRKDYPNLPFVFLTSMTNSSDNAFFTRIMDDLFSYYVPKDSGRELLIRRLRQIAYAFDLQLQTHRQTQQIRQNLKLASLVQHAVLPPWAYRSAACEFSYLYRPLHEISGDLAEYYPLNPGRSGLFIIGDISGHGTQAALAMMAVQSFLLLTVKEENASHPEEIARSVNQFLYDHLPEMVYMCALIVYWDFEHNLLRMLNAGQPEMYCLRALTGEPLPVNPDGRGTTPLGMFKNLHVSAEDVVEMTFPDDAIFFTFTDGLVDLSRDEAGEQPMSIPGIMDVARQSLAGIQPQDGLWSLPYRGFAHLAAAGFTHLQDDCTMLAIRKRLPDDDGSLTRSIPADPDAADRLASEFSDHVEHILHDPALATMIDLLLNEFLANIVQHGLDNQTRRHERLVVHCDAIRPGQDIRIVVWDHSQAWDTRRLRTPPIVEPNQRFDELNDANAVEGRGIPIMQAIARDIICNHYSGLNETIFVIPQPGEEQMMLPDPQSLD